jgi:peptidoglycan/LPS O-acetylase OafA/YrhL
MATAIGNSRYRADIDGLRAIAVLAVVLYHIRSGLFHGGYIGVDVFFVISGYLITGIIHGDVATNSFSVSRFYERRVRRIFPALFAVLTVSTILAGFLLLPGEFADFGKSLVATTLFTSNYYFMSQSSYFSPSVDMEPLLHTWSLAVEEQFYLLFPVVLILIHRFLRSYYLNAISSLAVLSLALSIALVSKDPTGAFYSSPARAWELLVGAVLALGTLPTIQKRGISESLGIVGLASVIGSAILFNPSTPFPGLFALVPTLGAALIIYSGMQHRTIVATVLGSRVPVFFGLISYSLYLWHWPLIVFSRLFIGHDLGKIQKISLLIVCVIISTLSWRFVERPWRRTGGMMGWARLRGVATAVMAIACLVGLVVVRSHGLPGRFSAGVDRLAAFTSYDSSAPYRQDRCFLQPMSGESLDMRMCMTLDPHRPNYLLIGDSHAADLWIGLEHAYPGINFLQATAVGCKPLLDARGPEPCRSLMQTMLGTVSKSPRLDAVLISADWSKQDLQPLLTTIASLHSVGRRVYVFGQVPEYQFDLPRLLAMSAISNDPLRVDSARVSDTAEVDRIFTIGLARSDARYVSLYRLMCGPNHCVTTVAGNVPIQFDTGHLTAAGSVWVAERMKLENFPGQAAAVSGAIKPRSNTLERRSTKRSVGARNAFAQSAACRDLTSDPMTCADFLDNSVLSNTFCGAKTSYVPALNQSAATRTFGVNHA